MKKLALAALLLSGASFTLAQTDYDNFSSYTGQSDFGFTTANVYMFNEITLANLNDVSTISFVAGNASTSTLNSTAIMYLFNSNGTTTSLGSEIGGINFGSLGNQAAGNLYSYTAQLSTPFSLASATSDTIWVGFVFNKGKEVLGSGSSPVVGSASGNILYGTNPSALSAENSSLDNFAVSLSPEPVTTVLAGVGLAMAIARRRRKLA